VNLNDYTNLMYAAIGIGIALLIIWII